MKSSFALLSLLAVFGAAKVQDAEPLPTVDGDLSGHTQADAEHKPATLDGYSAQNSQVTCQRGYPFYCMGRCCQLNRCCRNSCCNSKATFCGADGYCYY